MGAILQRIFPTPISTGCGWLEESKDGSTNEDNYSILQGV